MKTIKSLNNKGLTVIEVILCFVLISIITVSIYSVISTFNDKRIQEKYKEEIIAYRNLLTKEIEDDFIKIGITSTSSEINGSLYILKCILKDGTQRKLIVDKRNSDINSSYSIDYGPFVGTDDSNVMKYTLPDFGNTYVNDVKSNKILTIKNVIFDINDTSRVLRIYIGLYHPEFEERYSINIVSPINFNSVNDKLTPLGLN